MPAISSSAPGKVILCGEHAVVYGHPAIALPVFGVQSRCVVLAKPGTSAGEVLIKDPAVGLHGSLAALPPDHPLRRTVILTLSALSVDHLPACEIQIHSSVPIGGGLGSSASVTVAVTRAVAAFVGHPLDDETVNEIAFEVEKLHHKTPSGIDNSVITYAKPVFFRKDAPLQWLEITSSLFFLIANSGVKGSTGKAVLQVRENWQSAPAKYESLFNDIGRISNEMKIAFQAGSIEELGKLMTANHASLQQLGVSTPKLDSLVNAALEAGAYGAKLTGGGLGGNMIALVSPEKEQSIASALTANGAVAIITANFEPKGSEIA